MGKLASTTFQCGWIPEGPVSYELFGVNCAVNFDAGGAASVAEVSVVAFRLNGTSRTQLGVNGTGSEYVVMLSMTNQSGVTLVSKAQSQSASRLKTLRSARFDLLPAGAVSGTTYAMSDVLASREVIITRDGTDGANGSFTSTVFVRSQSKPATPTGGTYQSPYPTSKVTVGTEQRAWTDAPLSGTDPVWISRAVFNSSHTTTSPAWSDPVPAVDSTDIEFIWSAMDAPANPTGHPFAATAGGDWSKEAAGAVWMAVSVKNNGEWSDWDVVRIKGENAVVFVLDPGVVEFRKGAGKSMMVYLDIMNGNSRVKPDTLVSLNATGGGSSGTLADGLTWQWITDYQGRMAIGLTYGGSSTLDIEKTVSVVYGGKTYSRTLQIRTVADGENGVNGKNGVYVPPPMLFDDYPNNYKFQAGNVEKTPIDTRLDITLIRTNEGKLVPYRCILGYTKIKGSTVAMNSPAPDKDPTHWQAADAGVYKFLATDLLWANVGQIDFLSGQAFRVGDSSGMCGYFGTPTGETNGGAIFYSGGDSVSNATYVVYKDGKAVATNADISGRICTSIMDYKVSTSAEGTVPNGSLCFDTNSIKLPALSAGNVRTIKVYNPLRTRTTPGNLTLTPENSNVRISASRAFDTATSANKTLTEFGKNGDVYLELLGINLDGVTTWTVNVLSSSN